MNTKRTPSNYTSSIQALLNELPKNLGKIAAYDSGHGISICPDLGKGEVFTLDVVQSRFIKLPLPTSEGSDWYAEWDEAKKLINAFVKTYNRKRKGSV